MDIEEIIQEEIVLIQEKMTEETGELLPISLILTDDLFNDRKKYSISVKDLKVVEQNKIQLMENNGTVVLSKNIEDDHLVLISKSVFNYGDATWNGTIHHEFTHVYDLYNLLEFLGICDPDKLYDYAFYNNFVLWSEYHARINGFSRVLDLCYNDNRMIVLDKSNFIEMMRTRLKNTYETNAAKYELVQLIARHVVLQQYTNNSLKPFHKTVLTDIVNNHDIPKIIKIYKFLGKYDTFHKFQNHIKTFHELMDDLD